LSTKKMPPWLTAEFGKGFDTSNLRYMRLFYQALPNCDALRPKLSWTHYRLLLRVEERGKSGDTILVSENNWYGISRFYEGESGMEKNNSEIIIYQTEDGATKINVRLDGNSVWVTQTDLVELFQSSKSNISEHIKHIFEEGELNETAVVRKFRTTAPDGKNYNVTFYNLDVIISIGYRVKSLRGMQFRITHYNTKQ